MNPSVCLQCGAPLSIRRTGGQRKQFCDAVCRGKWHRKGVPKEAVPPPTPDDRAERRRILQHIHDELWADIAARGSMIDGRVNPAVEALRKVGAELERYSSVEVQQAPADPIEAALRAVS